MKVKIKKNDQVLIITGKDKNKRGKVLKILPKEQKIIVEDINIIKKHRRAKTSRTKGQIIEMPMPLSISKVMLICPKCLMPTRIGYSIINNDKYRICKKCKSQI